MAKRTIGEANIKITADGAKQVKAQLDELKSKTEEVGDAGSSVGQKIDGAFGKIRKRIQDSTSELRKFQRGIARIIGAVGGLAAIFVSSFMRIKAMIDNARESAEQFNTALVDLRSSGSNAARAIESFGGSAKSEMQQFSDLVQDQLDAVREQSNKALDAATKKFMNANTITNEQKRKAEAELLRDQGIIQRQQAAAIEKILEESEKKKADLVRKQEEQSKNESIQNQEEIADRITALRLAAMDEIERAEDELASRVAQLQEDIADSYGDSARLELLRQELDLVEQIGRAEIQAAKDARQQRQEQDESSRLAEELRKTQDALRENTKAAQDSAKIINDNNRVIERLYQQVVNLVPAVKKTSEESTRRRAM